MTRDQSLSKKAKQFIFFPVISIFVNKKENGKKYWSKKVFFVD